MSNPGQPLDPQMMAQFQAYQDQQRKMAMAQALMGNQAQGQNSGVANAGNSILGALTMQKMQQQNSPGSQIIQQRYGMSPSDASAIANPSLLSKIGGLFSMGGGS